MITLQPFTPADFDRLKSWVDSEATLVQFAGPIFQYPLTDAQLHAYLAEPQRHVYKAMHHQRPVGHAEILLSEDGVAKLCRILIGEAHDRGKGWGEQLVQVLVDICWRKFDVREIELNVYDWNTSAIHCYEKVGFVQRRDRTFKSQVGKEIWRAMNMVLRR